MRFYFILILLTFSANRISAQSYLVLHSGEEISYQKWTRAWGKYIVTLEDQEKPIEINAEDVLGYYKKGGKAFYYQKEYTNETTLLQTLPRIIDGTIKAYLDVDKSSSYTSGVGSTYNSSTMLYAEKGDKWVMLFSDQPIRNKKRMLGDLKEFVDQDPALLTKIESKSFKFKLDHIIGIIRKYNLKVHEPINNDTLEYKPVIFFQPAKNARRGATKKATIQLEIEGKQLTIEHGSQVEVMLPVGVLTKICVKTGNQQICDLIGAPVYDIHPSYRVGIDFKERLYLLMNY